MTTWGQIKLNYTALMDFFWTERGDPLDRFIVLPFFAGALLGYTVYAIAFFPWIRFKDKD